MREKNVKNRRKRGSKKPVEKNDEIPEELLNDERFKDSFDSPRFKPIPRAESKVVIDKRFGKMFTDKHFKTKATMDKRGRLIDTTTKEDLKKFYHVDEEAEGEDIEEEAGAGSSKDGKKGKKKGGKQKDSQESDDELLDLARGEGNVESSEEDSSDSDDGEAGAKIDADHLEWDELDKDAPRSDDISRRLAVCNLDWQNLKAQDIFVLMASFAPGNGVVRSVAIYPSEFGKERMRVESEKGPMLEKTEEALRKYEFDRLRYYYAVVECDTPETADAIYGVCDGLEYQTSGAKVDLRFIPDDMEFDESETTDTCDCMPENYEPIDFVNSALMLSTCESSWDTDDLRRKKALDQVYSKTNKKEGGKKGKGKNEDDVDRMADHLKTYLASDSEDEDAESRADAYRKLLAGENNGERKDGESDDNDGDREITFNPEIDAVVKKARAVKDDSEKKKLTPFQEYVERKKQKKRERRLADRAKRKNETAISDDELPDGVDANDDFFKQRLDEDGPSDEKVVEEPDEKVQQELELLLMDENDNDKKHFSLKKIVKNEKSKTKGRKSKNKAANGKADNDEFEIDVNDSRFAAIYTDHRFNIDPTSNDLKKTKGMNAVIQMKAKRQKTSR